MEEEAGLLEKLRQSDIQIEENPNLDSFKESVQVVYDEFEESIGKDLIEKVKALNK